MPFKMEAFTLLRACWSRCRVVHLMRTLPPEQTREFLRGYDQVLRKGFETLINCGLNNKWWDVARMNSKYGGMGLKSGIYTAGAQHLASLINSEEGIKRFIPSWDICKISKEASAKWLSDQLGR